MAGIDLIPDDLSPFAVIERSKAEAMIEDALAIAATVAPCILTEDFTGTAAAKAIIRGAILRWHEAGSGASTSQVAGPFSQGQVTPRKGMFWPSEITDLQKLCVDGGSGAFAVDTVSRTVGMHADICTLNFGGLYCSCGAVLTNLFPLYEVY